MPDVSEIHGWRIGWMRGPYLFAPFTTLPTLPRSEKIPAGSTAAVCSPREFDDARDRDHEVPDPDCGCGWYLAAERDDLFLGPRRSPFEQMLLLLDQGFGRQVPKGIGLAIYGASIPAAGAVPSTDCDDIDETMRGASMRVSGPIFVDNHKGVDAKGASKYYGCVVVPHVDPITPDTDFSRPPTPLTYDRGRVRVERA